MSAPVQACFCLILCTAALCLLFGGRLAVWTTTLRAAWCWAICTLIVLAAVEMVLGFFADPADAQTDLIRYASAVLVFTPTMALLGAKRPQNTAWQFIVVTLWGVLALPALELWMRGRGEQLVIDPVRSWFMLVMIVVGAGNHVPTRFGLAAAQLAIAQAVLLWSHLPWGGSSEAQSSTWVACGLFLTSALTARYAASRPPRDSHAGQAVPPMRSWSLIWRDFRDWYGTVWGVRVMERINNSAAMNQWPIRLGWDGFSSGDSTGNHEGEPLAAQIAPQQQAAIEQSLRNLLRRFVSSQWIEARLKVSSSSSSQGTAPGQARS